MALTQRSTTLTVREAGVVLGTKRLLEPVSLELGTGELVGLIGPSGSGKTTLLRTLAGVLEPTEGEVLLGGQRIAARSSEVGYLPVARTLHDALTVREALAYTAALRLGQVSPAEIATRIEEVLGELRLTERADTRIGSLSDGERRRAGVATELVGRPPVLVLDEPATGLDPGLERRLMVTLRAVASQGRGVIVATHATSSLTLCDKVAVLGPGGRLHFTGSPEEVLVHFGVEHFDEVYGALESGETTGEPGPAEEPVPAQPAARLRPPPAGRFARQWRLLTARYARTMVRDGRTLWVLLVQAPFIAMFIGVVLPRDVLTQSSEGSFYAVLVAFMLITGSIWLGVISASREIVKERAIIEREAAVGVRLGAYLAAKVVVIFALALVQVLLLTACALFLQPLHQPASVYATVVALCVLVAWAAAAMGLAVSALVRTPDQASASVPLLLIPQLLFAGAIIPTAVMPAPVQLLADLTFARWALAGVGGSLQLASSLSPDTTAVAGYQRSFFDVRPGIAGAAVALFAVISLLVAARAMRRRPID